MTTFVPCNYRSTLSYSLPGAANHSAGFIVDGVAIGTTKLSFVVTSHTGHVISSKPCDLQVGQVCMCLSVTAMLFAVRLRLILQLFFPLK